MAWMNNYIHVKESGVITHPCRNFNGGLDWRLSLSMDK